MKAYNKNLKQVSRDLRNNMTEAEKLLWLRLHNKKILNERVSRYENQKIDK